MLIQLDKLYNQKEKEEKKILYILMLRDVLLSKSSSAWSNLYPIVVDFSKNT